jgi:hypothetical protein
MSITTNDARDQADMERLAAGQDAALNDLMERHATPVFHFLPHGRQRGRRERSGAGNFCPRLPRPRQFSTDRKIFHLALHHRCEPGAESFPLAVAASKRFARN